MEKITSITELRKAILQLEMKQSEDKLLLKEELMIVYERMKPANVFKNSIKDLISSSDLINNLFNTSMGLAAGYLTKKAAVGSSHNPLKQIMGAFLQLGVSNVVTKNAGGIKSVAVGLVRNYLSRRKVNDYYQ
jgi:hypothetical protein